MRSGAPAASGRPGVASGVLLALPLALFLGLCVVWPLGRLAAGAFASPEAFVRVLEAGRYRTALVNSVAISLAASATAVAVAILPAWVFARERFPGCDLLRTAVSLPLTFSGVLVGFLTVVMLGRVGAVPKVLGLLTGREFLSGSAFTLTGLFAAYLYFEVPRAVMTLEAAFRRFPLELEAAARVLGAGPAARLFRVVLPLAAPALRSTLAITFSASMGSFGVALILARRFTVAPVEIYAELTAFLNDAVAGALCVALAILTLAVDRALFPRPV